MPGISIHVVDVARGTVAAGMRVELWQAAGAASGNRLVASGHIAANGVLDDPVLAARFEPGYYEARFHIAEFYHAAKDRAAGPAAPGVPFLDIVAYRFGVADPEAHYHLPMKCTPWGYSCFRGGA